MNTADIQLILIDDNEIDQLLHRKLIEKATPGTTLHQFTVASSALAAIQDQTIKPNHKTNIILLDIKMPVMDGFQFLEQYHLLPPEIKNNFSVYVLTSSLNQFDISRAKSNPYVKDMVIKPLNIDTLLHLIDQK
jgi:CheY-like chemotaxis protein